jgi:chromosomal replication initiation ATPase DnaA
LGRDLLKAAVERTGIGAIQILGRSRSRPATYARHLLMYVMREDGFTVADLSRVFNRDHGTVCEGIKRIERELLTRPETQADVAALTP